MTEIRYAYRTIKPAHANVGCSGCGVGQYETAIKIGAYVTENSTLNYIRQKHEGYIQNNIKPLLTLDEELELYYGK